MNRRTIASVFLVAILFVSAFAATIVYYNSLLNDRNSKIDSLNSQLTNQNNEIANLTSQVANLSSVVFNLTTANIVSNLTVTEIPDNSDLVLQFPNLPITKVPYYSLWINGSVTNIGHVTAYKAGLNVTAYASDGTLEINMTVPLVVNSVYGTDNPTRSLILDNPRTSEGNDIGSVHFGQIGSLQLGSLDVGRTTNIFLAIYHEGIVANWTVTPVWTNTHNQDLFQLCGGMANSVKYNLDIDSKTLK